MNNDLPFDAAKLARRVPLVLSNPLNCWSEIARDDSEPKTLVISLYAPLLVASTLVGFINATVFGELPFGQSVIWHIAQLIMAVLALFIGSFIAHKLSGFFGPGASFQKSLSLLVHAYIPALVGGICAIVPYVGWLVGFVLVIVALVAFFCGIQPMLGIADTAKKVVFFAAYLICSVVVSFVLGMVVLALAPTPSLTDLLQGTAAPTELEEKLRQLQQDGLSRQ
jgi:Yip1 domain